MPAHAGHGGTLARIREAGSPSVLVGCGVALVNISAVSAVGPILGLLQQEFKLSYAMVGLVSSTFGLARLATDLPAGYLAKRVNVQLLTLVGLVVLSLGSVLGWLAPAYAILLIARAVMGVGQSVTSTANLTWMSNVARPASRATAFAMYQTSLVTGLSLFGLLGGLLGTRYGWRPVFLMCAVVALLGIILVQSVRGSAHPAPAVSEPQGEGGLSTLSGLTRAQRLGLLGVCAASFLLFFNAIGFIGTLVPLYGHDALGLSPAAIGSSLALGSLLGLVFTLPGGVWADSHGRLQVMLPGLAAIALGSLLFAGAHSALGFTVAASVVGLNAIASGVPGALIGEIMPGHLIGPAMGMYRLAGDVGALVGPLALTATVAIAGYGAAMLLSAAVSTAVVVGCWFLLRPTDTNLRSPGRAGH